MNPPVFLNPTPEDQKEFLLGLYFGRGDDCLAKCIQRAYRDMNRTLHGLSAQPDRKALKNEAAAYVHSSLMSLSTEPGQIAQDGFDKKHREACQDLITIYGDTGFSFFSVGQAQKWINMSLKYIYVFGDGKLPGFAHVYDLAHVPLDNYIIDKLKPFGFPPLRTRWSRLRDYETYMDRQRWVRSEFIGSAPLAVEFHLWPG